MLSVAVQGTGELVHLELDPASITPAVQGTVEYELRGPFTMCTDRGSDTQPIALASLDMMNTSNAGHSRATVQQRQDNTWVVAGPEAAALTSNTGRSRASSQQRQDITWAVAGPAAAALTSNMGRSRASLHHLQDNAWVVAGPAAAPQDLNCDQAATTGNSDVVDHGVALAGR